MLIALVVVGHMISTVRTDTALGFGLYAYIYLFHMPAMILLSGVFAKPEVNPKAIKSTMQLLVIWLLWEGIWAIIHAVVEQKDLSKNFLVSPAWTLWFLVTLATMRVLLPYIARLRHPLLVSIALALVAPLFEGIGVQFSAARTLAFLPFFVVGWIARERGWLTGEWFLKPHIRARAWAWALLGGIAAVFALFSLVPGGLKKFWRIDKWLTHRDSYSWMFEHAPIGSFGPSGDGFAGWIGFAISGMLISLILLAVAAAITLAVLLVVPRGHSAITVWGARTLYVYLLHGVVVWFLRESGFIDWVGELGWIGIALLSALATGLAIVLSMGWVTRVFRVVIEPKFDWLLQKEQREEEPKPVGS